MRITAKDILRPFRFVRRAAKQVSSAVLKHPYLTGTIALAADQASKFAVRTSIPEGKIAFDRYGWFQIRNRQNAGSFFSQVDENSYFISPLIDTIVINSLVITFLAALAIRTPSKRYSLAYTLLLSGIIGNFRERLINEGDATDFILTNPWGLYPFTYNIADIAITFGVAGIVFTALAKWYTTPTSKT